MIRFTNTYNLNYKPIYNNINRSSNLSFGYDQEVNDKLKKEVKGLKPIERKTILDLQKNCNNLEDEIRKEEFTNDKYENNSCITMFIIAKTALAKLVQEFVPYSDFIEKEAETYADEADEIVDSFDDAKIQIDEDANSNQKTLKMDSNIFRNPVWRSNISESLYEIIDGEGNTVDDNVRNCTNYNEMTSSNQQDDKLKIQEVKPQVFSIKGFDDVSGLEDVKKSFKKHIIDPLNNPESVKRREELYGVTKPNGYLLYGPPGCGKTMIVEALASESKLPLFKLDIAKTGSPYIHQTSVNFDKFIEKIETFIQETNKPAILFIDEYDSFASSRDSLEHSNYKLEETDKLLEILNEASKKNIIVIAATNNLEMIDNAAKRTGRFDKKFKVGLPDQTARKQYLIQNLKDRKRAKDFIGNEKDMNKAVKLTKGYTFSDLNAICKETSDRADDNDSKITIEDFEYVIKHADIPKLDQHYLRKFGLKEEAAVKTHDVMYN